VLATSLPTAIAFAGAALPLTGAVLALLVLPSAALGERWLRPVPGDVARSFSYARGAPFAPGAHRGVDLAARPGAAVRAACDGQVVHAGPVAGPQSVVSIRCGGRRVSHLPLASVTVRAGEPIRAGTPIGAVAPGHGGLHLGVRREADRFDYEDPEALLPATGRPVPLGFRTSRPRQRAPRTNWPRALRARRPALTRPRATSGVTPRPLPVALRSPVASAPAPPASAPWVAWAGLALVLTGAAGSGSAIVVRRLRLAHRAPGRIVSRA